MQWNLTNCKFTEFAKYLPLAEKPKIYVFTWLKEYYYFYRLGCSSKIKKTKTDAVHQRTNENRTWEDQICSPQTNRTLFRAQCWPMLCTGKKTTYTPLVVYCFLSNTWKKGICDKRKKSKTTWSPTLYYLPVLLPNIWSSGIYCFRHTCSTASHHGHKVNRHTRHLQSLLMCWRLIKDILTRTEGVAPITPYWGWA